MGYLPMFTEVLGRKSEGNKSPPPSAAKDVGDFPCKNILIVGSHVQSVSDLHQEQNTVHNRQVFRC